MPQIAINNELYSVDAEPAHTTVLGFLRESIGLRGTKEGCASGDCGACTVLVREPDGTNAHTLNSCIAPLGAVLGKQLITVEGAGTPAALHPVQQAMVEQHGSQCGFCTPGFVMSLVAAQLQRDAEALATPSRSAAIESISGNLCRCTGYRPIVDAALAADAAVANGAPAPLPEYPGPTPGPTPPDAAQTATETQYRYERPSNLQALWSLCDAGFTRSLSRDRAQPWLLAGATDAFLEVTQRYLDPVSIIDLSDVAEVRGILQTAATLAIGAATSHAEALDYFAPTGPCPSAAICSLLQRFGSPQIRSRGTLGGNIANASPIADWPPLLLALDARLVIAQRSGAQRTLALADFYHDYKVTDLGDDEILRRVEIPDPERIGELSAHKISKRFEDDISSTMGAVYLRLAGDQVLSCRIGFGGVAATPRRCPAAEAALVDKMLTQASIDAACAALQTDISPIDDVRASADYRRTASAAVLRTLLLERLAGIAL